MALANGAADRFRARFTSSTLSADGSSGRDAIQPSQLVRAEAERYENLRDRA